MGGEDDAHPAPRDELLQVDAQAFLVAQIEQSRRFVENEDLRIDSEHRGQGHELTLTAGEFVDAAISQVGDAEFIEDRQCRGPTLPLGYGLAGQFDSSIAVSMTSCAAGSVNEADAIAPSPPGDAGRKPSTRTLRHSP